MAYSKVKYFILGIGKIIVPIVAILVLANSVTFKGEINPINPEETILSKISKVTTPLLNPIGINDNNWQATLALITGFFAKEVLVATLEYLYFPNLEETENNNSIIETFKAAFIDFKENVLFRNYLDFFELNTSIENIQNADNILKKNIILSMFGSYASVFSFLLFILIYTPCVSAMGAISKELGHMWSFLVGIWSLFNAYVFSYVYYQIAISTNILNIIWVIGKFFMIYIVVFAIFKYFGRKYSSKWNNNFIFNKKTNCKNN